MKRDASGFEPSIEEAIDAILQLFGQSLAGVRIFAVALAKALYRRLPDGLLPDKV